MLPSISASLNNSRPAAELQTNAFFKGGLVGGDITTEICVWRSPRGEIALIARCGQVRHGWVCGKFGKGVFQSLAAPLPGGIGIMQLGNGMQLAQPTCSNTPESHAWRREWSSVEGRLFFFSRTRDYSRSRYVHHGGSSGSSISDGGCRHLVLVLDLGISITAAVRQRETAVVTRLLLHLLGLRLMEIIFHAPQLLTCYRERRHQVSGGETTHG